MQLCTKTLKIYVIKDGKIFYANNLKYYKDLVKEWYRRIPPPNRLNKKQIRFLYMECSYIFIEKKFL